MKKASEVVCEFLEAAVHTVLQVKGVSRNSRTKRREREPRSKRACQ